MRPKREFDIHDIIKHYPYFLGREFSQMTLIHEKIYPDRKRADFVFFNEQKVIVVEVKKGTIDSFMLTQLSNYLERESSLNKGKKLEGMLVGLPTNNKELKKKIKSSKYAIVEKILNIDVPSDARQIKICAEPTCRKANWQYKGSCEYCGSSEFIQDPFTFVD